MTTYRTVSFVTVATAAASVVMAGLTLTSVASPYKAPLAAARADVVHQLPRVVVTGHVQRGEVARIVELPRVVVTGRPIQVGPTIVTQEDAPTAQRS